MANKPARIVGVDLEKTVFHLHGVDETGGIVVRVKLPRQDVLR